VLGWVRCGSSSRNSFRSGSCGKLSMVVGVRVGHRFWISFIVGFSWAARRDVTLFDCRVCGPVVPFGDARLYGVALLQGSLALWLAMEEHFNAAAYCIAPILSLTHMSCRVVVWAGVWAISTMIENRWPRYSRFPWYCARTSRS
jgi:hypothetical protein